MSYCYANDDCKRPNRSIPYTEKEHSFAGYGWYATYHAECCPGAMDGSPCFQIDDGHPEGWQPRDPAYFEQCLDHYNKPWPR